MSALVIDAAIGAAWAMEEAALVTLLDIAAREHQVTPQALEAYKAEALDKAERASVRNGVAILRVEGPLFKRANLMTEFCGASSYDVLRRDLATALDNGNVRSIMLAIDSPGGEAAGCAEFAAAVAAARGRKPLVAYVADVGASAAYWIASACDAIVCGPSAALGSIGVRMSIPDTRERDARAGLRRFEFVSSQSPYKVNDPATKDGNARIKARVDALATVFVEAVAENRGVSVAKVLDSFGRGDVLIGAAAVAAGMADRLGSFESTLAGLASPDPLASIGLNDAHRGSPQAKENTMPTTEEMNAAVEQARAEAAATATAAAEAAHATALAEASAAASAAERERVAGLFEACFAGHEQARDEAIRSGSSVAAFKAMIVEKEHAKAKDRAGKISVDVQQNEKVHAAPGSEPNPKTGDEAAVEALLGAYRAFH